MREFDSNNPDVGYTAALNEFSTYHTSSSLTHSKGGAHDYTQ